MCFHVLTSLDKGAIFYQNDIKYVKPDRKSADIYCWITKNRMSYRKMDEHILIVEDDDAIRNSIHEFLTKSDFKAFSAPSAEDAFDIIKSGSIQIVITDILLPGMDGLKLTSQIKKNYSSQSKHDRS